MRRRSYLVVRAQADVVLLIILVADYGYYALLVHEVTAQHLRQRVMRNDCGEESRTFSCDPSRLQLIAFTGSRNKEYEVRPSV